MVNLTTNLDSFEPSNSKSILGKGSPSNSNFTPELATVLKQLNIACIVMADTGECIEINGEQLKPKEKAKKKKKSPKPKNRFGDIDPTIAGIDIGDKLIHVAIPDGDGNTIVKEFGTMTPDLKKISEELKKENIKTAVMESTGIYFVPLYEILEESGLEPVLVDASKVRSAPGRKSDVVDCQWIQFCYSNGMLQKAYRPPKDRLKLRSYNRQRLSTIELRQIALSHLEKSLQLMNIKLSTAVSEIGSLTGMAIIREIANGEKDPVKLARLRHYRCKKPNEIFVAALTGNFQDEHVFALKQALELYDFATSQILECEKKIQDELERYPTITNEPTPVRAKDKKKNAKFERATKPKKYDLSFDARNLLWKKFKVDLTAYPGIQASIALTILTELGGTDMKHWKSSKQFASWLRLCPGNNISGGRRRKSKREPCGNYISQALRMAAMAAKKSNTALGSHIRRITGRTDKPKGIKAGAHKLAVWVYHMCKDGWEYCEKGADAYDKAHEERCLKMLTKKARDLGYELKPIIKIKTN